MTQTTVLAPTSVLQYASGTSAWSLPGGGTYLGNTTDGDNNTYARWTPTGDGRAASLTYSIPSAGLPDGAAIESVEVELISSNTAAIVQGQSITAASGATSSSSEFINVTASKSGNPGTKGTVTAGSGAVNPDPATNGGVSAQTIANQGAGALRLSVSCINTITPFASHDVFSAKATIKWVNAPTASGLAPIAGQTSVTTRPTLEWTDTNTDGVPIDGVQGVVWALADIQAYPGGRAAFEANPTLMFGTASAGSAPTFVDSTSGTRTAKAWTVDAAGNYGFKAHTVPGSGKSSWTPDQALPATGAMVAYVRTKGTYAGSPITRRATAGVAISDFTMAATPPPAPTSVTPVWQYPRAAAPNNVSQYRMKVDVAVPAQTMTGFTKCDLEVQHLPAGSADYQYLPVGVLSGAIAAGTYTLYDTLAAHGRAMTYRARIVKTTSAGLTIVSAWTTSSAVTPVYDSFVLRDPLVSTDAVAVPIQGDLEASSNERSALMDVLGTAMQSSISDSISGDSWSVRVMLGSAGQLAGLRALRAKRTTMAFHGDMDGWWRWVRFGPQWTERTVRSTRRNAESTRLTEVTFTLTEAPALYNQPAPPWGA